MQLQNRAIRCAVVCFIGFGTFALEGHAAAERVRVHLPDFTVKLNGNTVDNTYRQYPLLVYKDITYFPMTWYDTKLLGLETAWSPESGFSIIQRNVASSYMPYTAEQRNEPAYFAEAPASLIAVNGETIDNSKEPYPLLSFRDVTYFPLTWRFAHDQFGWDYRWDGAEGLSIQSYNPQLQTVDLPPDASKREVALYKGYYYFTETTGTTIQLYRTSAAQPYAKELIYSYDFGSANGMDRGYSIQIREDELWFVYHVGGAVMGRDVFVHIGEDGKAEIQHSGYLDFRNTPYGKLIVNLGVPPTNGNLMLATAGQERRLGDPELIYGLRVTITGTQNKFSGDASTSVHGDLVYVLASRQTGSTYSELNTICRVNLITNETVQIVNSEFSQFRIVDNTLYYIKSADNALYASGLDGTGERKLADKPVSWFDVLDGHVYYTTEAAEGKSKYQLYEAMAEGEDPLVLQALLDGVEVIDDKLLCRLDQGKRYGAVLLDSSGWMLLAVADPIARTLPSDDSILFVSARDTLVKIVR
ncbi:DUF5050 domain-containing protein [Paenibacillus chartarius]|uniref:DUF5050 domain-containing protein n=1 Tax=Paenibacillus chartarius TaxID=747481 RepID=A0ABV6DVP5_9BACL